MTATPSLADMLVRATRSLPGGGEDRPGQLQMAEAVRAAIEHRRHLVARAGTGTGKTLAYLLPAIAAGRPVVVATATRALQDQLAGNDLPTVARVMAGGAPVRFAVLKGRSNYLCRQRAAEVAGHASWNDMVSSGLPEGGTDLAGGTGLAGGAGLPDGGAGLAGGVDLADEPPLELPGFAAHQDRRPDLPRPALDQAQVPGDQMVSEVRALLEWAATSATGDRAELAFEPGARSWASVSVGPRECPGTFRCPSGDHCFAERARSAAAEADVVVVNTALYTAHLAAERAVLPEHDLVVFDEAHEVEEIVSRGLGVELTPGRIRAVAAASRGLLGREASAAAEAVMTVADQFEAFLLRGDERRLRLGDGSTGRGPGRGAAPGPGAAPGSITGTGSATGTGAVETESEAAWEHLLVVTRGRVEELARAVRAAADPGPGIAGHAPPADVATRRQRALLAIGHLSDDLSSLVDPALDQVVWVAGTGPRARSVRAAPVEVGPLLAQRLWPEVTGILTSATMPPGMAARLGLPADRTDHIDVGSPFPYRRTTLLYVPTAIGDRRRPDADAAAWAELVSLMQAAGGRTLALFTSWRAMGAAATAVRSQVPFEVLAQGDASKATLLRRFADEEETCLFATMSFWQGVDVPGRSSTLVVLDRLPFPRPDDPLLQARRERAGAGAFAAVDLPRAATLLAQGAGRLVRRATDTGVVAVLDPRLATAGYRRALLDALPPMRRTVDHDEVVAFLERVTSAR